MTPQEHYEAAEALLVEGVEVVKKISGVERVRHTSVSSYAEFTREMDELGKKAMGIWAQAQVHATLATRP